MFREVFKKVKDIHGLTGKAIAEESGMPQQSISRYLTEGRDMRAELLAQLVEAMDRLSPGAKQDFGKLVAGGDISEIDISLMTFDEKMNLIHSLIDEVTSASKYVNSRRQKVLVK